MVGCIIAKLPLTCRDFSMTLKHKRENISIENLFASHDAKEKADTKDGVSKTHEAHSNANVI